MPTYPVTGTLADLGLEPRSDLIPVLEFTPPEVVALSTGQVIFTEPVEVEPASNGAFAAPLASTDDLLHHGKGWQLRVRWQRPDGYAPGEGYSAADSPTWFLRVPRGGGRLVDFINAKVTGDVIAIVNDPDDQALLDDLYSRGVRVVIDTSVTPVDFYRLEA